MLQRAPAHAGPLASPWVFGAALGPGPAGCAAPGCLLPAAGAGRFRWVHPLSVCNVLFHNIFPPSFNPPAVVEGVIYPGWSKKQHTLT